MTDDMKFALGFCVLIALVIGGTFSSKIWVESKRCTARAAMMGTPCHFTLWTGCMVQTSDGRWVPLRNYRVIENRGPE